MTEKEARKKLGPKMCARLDAINEFLRKYNYGVWLHSTSVGDGIIKSNEGLRLNVGNNGFGKFMYRGRDDLNRNITVSERILDELEKEAKKNPGKVVTSPKRIFLRRGKSDKADNSIIGNSMPSGGDFAEDPQSRRATTVSKGSHISAVDLLTFNHQDQMQTVIGVFPIVPHPDYHKHYDRTTDSRYLLRGDISCEYDDESEEFEYAIRAYYPQKSILMVYDRSRNRVLLNKNFDERDLVLVPEKKRTDIGYPSTGTLMEDMKRAVDDIEADNIDASER